MGSAEAELGFVRLKLLQFGDLLRKKKTHAKSCTKLSI